MEGAHEELVDVRTAELARRERDVVDDQERDALALGAVIEMGRGPDNNWGQTPIKLIQQFPRSEPKIPR
jgi:hypothetical protein